MFCEKSWYVFGYKIRNFTFMFVSLPTRKNGHFPCKIS